MRWKPAERVKAPVTASASNLVMSLPPAWKALTFALTVSVTKKERDTSPPFSLRSVVIRTTVPDSTEELFFAAVFVSLMKTGY
jgi:hypothetical protein